MSDKVVYILAVLGIAFVLALGGMLFFFIKFSIGEIVSHFKWKYKYKHRFDKSPTAKCYCKDCKSYCSSTGNCSAHAGWKVADSWFCWSAEPRKYDPEKQF